MAPAPRDFGQQTIGTEPGWLRPSSPYRRYLWDLYGPTGRNWMPLLNAGLLASVVALMVAVAWAVFA